METQGGRAYTRKRTSMTNARVKHLDANFSILGRGDLDVFDGEGCLGLPGHGSLAGDGLESLSKVEQRAKQ